MKFLAGGGRCNMMECICENFDWGGRCNMMECICEILTRGVNFVK